MHTYLLLHTNIEKRISEINKQVTSLGISPFDCVTPTFEGTSIGIADIRMFIKRLILAPLEGSYSAGIIATAELLTLEAQQALLKTLEEPPAHVYIFLGAANNMQLIPTIISRCITVLQNADEACLPEEDSAVRTLINGLLSASPGKKIHLVGSVGKTKEEIERFIDSSVRVLRTDLITENSTPEIRRQKIHLAHRLLNAKKHLPHNVNPLLIIEQALL